MAQQPVLPHVLTITITPHSGQRRCEFGPVFTRRTHRFIWQSAGYDMRTVNRELCKNHDNTTPSGHVKADEWPRFGPSVGKWSG